MGYQSKYIAVGLTKILHLSLPNIILSQHVSVKWNIRITKYTYQVMNEDT